MAKSRFAGLRSIITLFTKARSTEWPGPSRYAIYLPLFCLVIAVAQLGANVTLGSKLLNIGEQVACREGGRTRMAWLPVTYALVGGDGTDKRAKMSMRENQSRPEILFTAILTPMAIVILLMSLFLLHIHRVSNRIAMLMAFCLLSLFMIANAQDTWLRIDTRNVHTDYPLCYQSGPEMDALWEARHTRSQLLVAGEVLSGLGSLLVVFYIVLTITAASLNRAPPPQASTTRLQNLPSDDSLPEPPLLLPPPQLRLRPLSPVQSIKFADHESETTLPQPLPKPYKTKIEEAEKRIKEYREANLSRTSSNPFVDAENGVTKQEDTVQNPETGKWRKDSTH